MTKDVISLSISVLLLFRHYISHKITFGAPAVAGYYAVLAVLLFNQLVFRFEKCGRWKGIQPCIRKPIQEYPRGGR